MSEGIEFQGGGAGASSEGGEFAGVADELGAHVSVAGGVQMAPERARAIESLNLQLFTKQPNRWAEPEIDEVKRSAYRAAWKEHGIRVAGSHDSYLINLSSPKPELWERSFDSFRKELERCVALELDFLVTHPGNATDGDADSGIARNAEGVARALEEVSGPTRVLLEITAGSGTSVGGSFESLARILEGIPEPQRSRVGICFDTCHAYSAGYDLVGDYDGVWAAFDDLLGLERLGLFHLNDSKHPFGSNKDRHEHIGEGSLGEAPFRRIMTDERFMEIPKVLETPKGDDMVTLDRKNLARLRGYRGGA
ncbi:MAG: deoxyribonuclease IV [Gemmatimonadales bacterium]|nr:MAG: deoxyribonuclease IV [Gemmatimonadales bacterium]